MGQRWSLGAVVILLVAGLAALSACQGPQGAQGPAGPTSPTNGTISGVVKDAAGKPAEGAAVSLNPLSIAAVKADAAGKFSLANVPAGIYTITATKAGYNAGFQGPFSVVAGSAQAKDLTLSPEAPFPIAQVKGVSFRLNDKDTYTGDAVWLTTHYSQKGDFSHNEKIIVTSGLNNVGVGSYVYLQGREKDGHDKALSNFKWKVTGPYGGTQKDVAVTLENASTLMPRFKAERVGAYTVDISATNADGATLSTQLTVNAGKYAGVELCATCHSGNVMPDKVGEWRQTGHATKMEDFYGSYSPTSDYCIGCHTTGYNEQDTAGGFDEKAVAAGWDKSKSVTAWLKDDKWTVDQIKASPMGQLMNIQCETCHGPGGSAHTKAKSFEPSVCNQCHPQGAQWQNSGHAKTGYNSMHQAESTSCVECHTGQGFVEVKVRGNKPVFPSMATPDNPATLMAPGELSPVACAACHDPHAFDNPVLGSNGLASRQLRLEGKVTMPNGATVDAAESAVCVSCHANKRDLAYKANFLAGKNTRGVHDNAQADSFYGITAAAFDYGKGNYGSSPHPLVVKEGCIQCHMAPNPVMGPGADGKVGTKDDIKAANVGAHTWSVKGEFEGKPVENTAACMASGCHAAGSITTFNRKTFADYDGNGKVEGIQDEVKGLLAALAAKLPKDPSTGAILSSTITATNTTEAQRMALWNYSLIANDGSAGVHNSAFAVQVLQRTYQQLTGLPVPGATIR